jgi:hypothetical protein
MLRYILDKGYSSNHPSRLGDRFCHYLHGDVADLHRHTGAIRMPGGVKYGSAYICVVTFVIIIDSYHYLFILSWLLIPHLRVSGRLL